MNQINIESVIKNKAPGFFKENSKLYQKIVVSFLKKLLHIYELNAFIEKNQNKPGFEVIDEFFEDMDFSYLISEKDRKKIPAEGKLICVSNHPLGGLDGLVLLKVISEVRRDVKIVVNDVLMNIGLLNDLFLPYNIFERNAQKRSINLIKQSLSNEEAIIFFPAAEVSRLSLKGIRDNKWHSGAIRFAQNFNAPILPMFVEGRNSLLFYLVSSLNKSFSMFLLPNEMFCKRHDSIFIKIGDPISKEAISNRTFKKYTISKLLRKHVYKIGKGSTGYFNTEKTIIHPIPKKILNEELHHAQLLAETCDKKKILLVEYEHCENVLKEIGRLREQTFRAVGEGTGKKFDLDKYDRYYQHIVLWDEEELEIIGSYRLGLCGEIFKKYGPDALYTSTQFKYHEDFYPVLNQSLELGRSFIQKKYWRSNALDQLWTGIAAVLNQNRNIKYLNGAVSISDSYSSDAKNMIVYFYKKWFAPEKKLVEAYNPYRITRNHEQELADMFCGETLKDDQQILKKMMKNLGFSIPVLFHQYSKLCEDDGVFFHDFNIDKDFSYTVDGYIVLEIDKIKQKKKERYNLHLEELVETV